MKILKYVFAVLLAATLVACGGGGGSAGTTTAGGGSAGTSTAGGSSSGTSTTTTTVTASVTPAAIELIGSSNSLPSATGTVAITALVKNASNAGVPGVTVVFGASSGVLQGGTATTDANGVATVNLVPGSNRTNRTIVVTATSGTVVGTLNIGVVGTTLSASGNGALLLGAVSTYSFRALDSSGNPISGVSLAVSSALGNGLNSSTITTDGTGNATVIYTANFAGNDTLAVSGLGTTGQMTVSVSGEDFSFQTPAIGTGIPIGTAQTVTVRYLLGGAGAPGRTVTFATTRGTVSAATVLTDAAGIASTTVSSNTSGPATVNASIAGVAQSGLPVEFLATLPATLVLQANPNAIAPNASGTANRASLLAIVRDASSNPVKNVAVNFSAVDPSGGTITPGSGTTDSNGQVQVSFVSGPVSTPSNGVALRAAVSTNPSVSGTASLTVSGRALFIAIGTGNVINNLNVSTYQKPFTVYVTDSNGAAVTNQSVVLSVFPTVYLKGQLTFQTTGWQYSTTDPITACPNEDLNADGFKDAGEDNGPFGNNDGVLTPGGVVLVSPGTVVTDSNGFANFDLLYGEQYAPWILARIRASATVAGTESQSSISFGLSGVASDFSDSSNPPAGRLSPFGTAGACTNPL